MTDQRNHDLGLGMAAGLLDRDQGVQDRAGLDLHEVRDHQAEATAAQAEHRVLLVHRLDGRQQLLVLLGRGIASPGDLDQLLLEVGQELVKRWVDQADDDRQAVHGLEDPFEVTLLEDLQLGHRRIERGDRLDLLGGQRCAGRGFGFRPGGDDGDQDRPAHDLEPLALAEHVFRPAQANPLGTVAACLGRLLGLVGVRPDLHPPDVIGVAEDLLQLGLVLESGIHGRQCADVQGATRAIEADPVTLLELGTGDIAVCLRTCVVHDQVCRARHAWLPDLARDHGRVGGGPAPGGDDPLCHGHAVEVVR